MTISKIIIATTAICRIDIHNQSFPSYLKFLDNIKDEYEIIWFINVDCPDYCNDNFIDTIINLKKILKDYNIKIINNDNPDFLKAVRNLLELVKPEITNNSCLLWLEDDWIANNKFDLKFMIDKLLLPYSYINLVFNNLGSLPPFLMGNELTKIYVDKFNLNKRQNNPENISRGILRSIAQENGIVYYSMFNKDYVNELKNNHDLNDNINYDKLCYEENYLKIDNNCILVENSEGLFFFNSNPKFVNINVHNIQQYRNNNSTNNIIFIRFGYADMHSSYNYSFFKDIGRDWKKNVLST